MNSTQYDAFVTTAKGLEDLLENELIQFDILNPKISLGGVHINATQQQLLQTCLHSRIANRVLLKISEFIAEDEHQLYDNIIDIDWSNTIPPEKSFAIDCNVRHSNITHNHYASLKVKDAIVDQIRENSGVRPNIDTKNPDVRLNLYINRNNATLYLDLSGDSLHKRGYRKEKEHAPLKENLAAAILYRCKWPDKIKQDYDFLDPMCGSGTLLIEAALITTNTPPGLLRENFGFFQWSEFDESLWLSIISQAKQQIKTNYHSLPSITGYDVSKHAITAAEKNILAANLSNYIHIEKRDITDATPRKQDRMGLIVVNPPYGKRLENRENVPQLYETLGRQIYTHFPNWDVGLFTDDLELGKKFPLRARNIHSLFNGAIECKLLHFSVKKDYFIDIYKKYNYIKADRRSENSKSFANRLTKNVKHFTRWANKNKLSSYRIYDADIPEYAIAVDLYQSQDQQYFVVQEYEAPKTIDENTAKLRLNEALSILSDNFNLNPANLFIKHRKQQKGSQQYEKQESVGNKIIVQENEHLFYVNFSDYLDTGLFLDHRLTRAYIESIADQRHFLNLFSYTSTAGVYAAKGGAKSTTNVDMSNTYLNWSKENYKLNNIIDKNHFFIQNDCLEWLKHQDKKYDLIFLDPPSFSNSKRMEHNFSIQRDHVNLLTLTLSLLEKDGILIFSNNFRKFKLEAEHFPDFDIQNMTNKTISEDFKRNKKIHNCWKITHSLN